MPSTTETIEDPPVMSWQETHDRAQREDDEGYLAMPVWQQVADLNSFQLNEALRRVTDMSCICNSCRNRRTTAFQCTNCDGLYDYLATDSDFELCAACYTESNSHDDDDCDDDDNGNYVHNHSYTPRLQFKSAPDEREPRLFFGFELEVPAGDEDGFARRVYETAGDRENLLYCKEDGSIDGVEIVSHPMTHAYFSECAPLFDMFRDAELSSNLTRQTPSNGYGLHVHVSRSGFKSEAHTLRWLLLIYRNQRAMAQLARRGANEWAGYGDAKDCTAKARNKHPDYKRDPWNANYSYSGNRYVAVNANNRDTFELRMFRSTWKEQQLRAAVDFAHASVEYTRGMRAYDALHGGLTWDAFRAWAAERPEYSNLTAELARLDRRAARGTTPGNDDFAIAS